MKSTVNELQQELDGYKEKRTQLQVYILERREFLMNQSLYNSTKSEYELFEQRCLSAKLDYSAIHQEIVAAEESKKSLEEKKKVNQNEQEFYNEVIQNQQENIVLLCDDIASLREDCEMIRVECNMNDEDSDVHTAQLENKVFLFHQNERNRSCLTLLNCLIIRMICHPQEKNWLTNKRSLRSSRL